MLQRDLKTCLHVDFPSRHVVPFSPARASTKEQREGIFVVCGHFSTFVRLVGHDRHVFQPLKSTSARDCSLRVEHKNLARLAM